MKAIYERSSNVFKSIKKILSIIVLLLMITIAISGCGSSGDSSNAQGQSDNQNIVNKMKSLIESNGTVDGTISASSTNAQRDNIQIHFISSSQDSEGKLDFLGTMYIESTGVTQNIQGTFDASNEDMIVDDVTVDNAYNSAGFEKYNLTGNDGFTFHGFWYNNNLPVSLMELTP